MPDTEDTALRMATIASLAILFRTVITGFRVDHDTVLPVLETVATTFEDDGNSDAAELMRRIKAASAGEPV